MNVAQYMSEWLGGIKSDVKPRTYESYDLNVRRLQPLIGRVRLTSVTPSKIDDAKVALLSSGISARSVRQALTVLHTALEAAVARGYIGRNPAKAVTPPRVERHEMKTLNEDQLRTLFRGTDGDRDHALWVLLATSGLRLGEALGLRWSDQLEDGTMLVNRALQRQREAGLVFAEPKTKRSRRPVYLPPSTLATLKAHRRRQLEERLQAGRAWKDQDLIFCKWDGGPMEPSSVVQRFHGVLRRLGLPDLRVHDLRHTAASLHLKKGTHPKVVQEMLGHSTISVTLDTYSHVAPGMHAEAAKVMETLFEEAAAVSGRSGLTR
jgi:integrase